MREKERWVSKIFIWKGEGVVLYVWWRKWSWFQFFVFCSSLRWVSFGMVAGGSGRLWLFANFLYSFFFLFFSILWVGPTEWRVTLTNFILLWIRLTGVTDPWPMAHPTLLCSTMYLFVCQMTCLSFFFDKLLTRIQNASNEDNERFRSFDSFF